MHLDESGYKKRVLRMRTLSVPYWIRTSDLYRVKVAL